MQGWIKLHRKITEASYYNRPAYVAVWIHILLTANHKEKKVIWNGKEITIQPGQFITGRKKLSESTGVPQSTLEDILNFFESSCQIRQQKTTKYRLITVLKWDQYQVSDNKATTKQQQADTNKNVKNYKNKEGKPSSPLTGNKKNKTMPWNLPNDNAADENFIDYDSREEIKPAAKKKNKSQAVIGLLKQFKDLSEKQTGVRPAETKGEYHMLTKAMKTHQLEKEDVENLYDYFFADAKLKPEQHSSIGLCISGAYITQWRVNQKRKPVSQVEAAADIKL